MLKDKNSFQKVESILAENGTIEKFESENGKIKGRLMIAVGEVPEDLETAPPEESDFAFIGTYDFYDMEMGIVINTVSKAAKSGLWMIPQSDDAEEPAREWIEFFIEKLVQGLNDDGSFGIPMYTFISDTADFTVVPTVEN